MALNKVGPNKWRITVSVRDPKKGYPITKQKTVIGTQKEAQAIESDMIKEIKSRSLISSYASTFGEALDLQLEHIKTIGECVPRQEQWYRYLRGELGHIRLEVFADYYEQYIKNYEHSITLRGSYPSNGTINRYTATVRAVFNRLVKRGILDKNPITEERFQRREEKPRDRYLTPNERQLLLTTIRQYRPFISPIIEYMMAIPCRLSELTTARVEQYSPLTETIYVPDSKARIPLYKPVPPWLRDYFRSIPQECPYLFYRYKNGKYYDLVHKVKPAWNYCVAKAGIKDIRLHDLRHMAATDLVKAGNPERVVMDIAGWKTNMLATYWSDDKLQSARHTIFAQQPDDYRVARLANVV